MQTVKTVLMRLLRIILCLVSVVVKTAIVLTIPAFMMWFNYTVDVSGLFQGELAPRDVANMLLEGKTVSNYDKMEERKVLELYVKNLPEDKVPDTLALGSSRVMQLNQSIVGGSYYNGGMSGASIMDVMNNWYLFERAGKLPKNLILCVDPWLFNGVSAETLNRKADAELFNEFLSQGLGIDSGTPPEPADPYVLVKALLSPSYFQGNVHHYREQQTHGKPTNEDGSAIPFFPVEGDISQLDYAIKFPDGSMQYPVSFRNQTGDQILSGALEQAGTIAAMHGFSEMDPYWTDLFDQFVQHVRSKGVNVVFLLTPYHPFIALHVHNNPQGLEGFFQVEPWLRNYSVLQGIPLYGSYHPGRSGIPGDLFFDGIHCRGEALQLMFPGIEAALQGQHTSYETQYLEKYGDVANSRNALIGIDADCAYIDPAWFAAARAPVPPAEAPAPDTGAAA